MIWLLLVLQITGTILTTEDKISWVVSGISEEYSTLLWWRYYIEESRIGTEIKDVKCSRNVPNDSTKLKCIMQVPKLMRGTYKIYITSTDRSTGIESEKAPYFITIVDKPPTPIELRKE